MMPITVLIMEIMSGLAFYAGVAHPAWSDNSNSTGDNPDDTLFKLDIYTAAVTP